MSTLAEKPQDVENNIDSSSQDGKPTPPSSAPGIPPEEGVAGWLCVVGSSIGLFCTFGFLNAIGVFQTYYETNTLRAYDPSTISWIFALQLCLIWIPGPIFGRILDSYGPKPILIPCSILCVFSLCMTSLCTQYYQIILAQGLGFGLGACGIFTTCFVCPGQWFERRRGLALGIVTSGSSLGGVIFPFFVAQLIPQVGFNGTVRYTALFIGILLLIACCLVNSRMPRKPFPKDLLWFDFKLFADKSFALYTIGAFLVMWGLWAPFDYLPSMAQKAGFSPSLSIYLISILNAASVPGRILPGHLADKFGYFNTMTIVCLLAGISIIALWIPFDYSPSHAGIIIFAAVYGFLSGAFISLIMPCAAKSGSLQTLGQRFGTFQGVIAFSCLTGLPISGAILNTQGGFYLGLQFFSAVAMVVGACFIGASRVVLGGASLRLKV
ncbi:MFS transporter-9 [Coleophoma crateriformis]|uniref:MFS transporter-9 n=1 Tax=Coleophoma crateriformis TaxID=565419 RepID=A0A3D8Q4I7_9HELO|nr:MFS transporter-9 [Coleophoma crateriformis]